MWVAKNRNERTLAARLKVNVKDLKKDERIYDNSLIRVR